MNCSILPIGSILLSLLVPCPILCEGHGFSRAVQARVTIRPLAPQVRPISQISGSAVQSALPLPSANSAKLRAALLATGTTHLSPQWKNPAISQRGLAPSIVSTLQQQQEYLRSSAPATHSTAVATTCDHAIVRSVNGKTAGAIFTPQVPDNLYRIEGCLFGTTPGHLLLEPHPDSTQRIPAIPLRRSAWSANEIDVHLDPHLSGIPDVPVTLVIHLDGGRRLELPGCLFVAARSDPRLLESIPASWISLQPSVAGSRSIERLEYVSPPIEGSGVPIDAAGSSAFVSRLDAENFGAGADVYDFTQLNPGWVVDSFQLRTYAVSCPGTSLSRQSWGHWDTRWNGRKLTVRLQDDVCNSRVSPSFTFNLSVSQYALKVWVVGPVGTKPLADALMHNQNRSLTQPN